MRKPIGFDDRARAITCNVEDVKALAAAGLSAGSADRVLMNPPFHDARRHNVSPDAGRRLAHAGESGLLSRWIAAAAFLLKPHGVLTLIWRADELQDVLAALAHEFGAIAVMPVQPREGAPAIRVLVRAVKGGSGAPAFRPALSLNDAQGRPSTAAEAVLRGGQKLTLAEDESAEVIRRLNFARYAHEIAPTAVDQLPPHAREILVGEVRKHDNRTNKHEQHGELGIHCFFPCRSRP